LPTSQLVKVNSVLILVELLLKTVATALQQVAFLFVVKDCEDPNPLIRALAVRTMGCIRVDKITEYLCEPLRKCLKDEDPYVRKTAAVCVAKLYDISSGIWARHATTVSQSRLQGWWRTRASWSS
jgi:hypothetical protein